MTAQSPTAELHEPTTSRPPLFGGLLWRLARRTGGFAMPLAGKRWNPIFAVLEHRGRRSGRTYATPVAARRTDDGFVISLAFGAQVDWYRNVVAAGGGAIRWRGATYAVADPRRIGPAAGIAAFNAVQRFFLRLGAIDGYVHLRIVDAPR